MSGPDRAWTIEVDQTTCLGTGVCCFYAPATFDLDDEGRSMVVDQHGDPDDAVRNAVEACPTHSVRIVQPGTGSAAGA